MNGPIELVEEETSAFEGRDFDQELALGLYERFGKQISVGFPSPLNAQCFELRPGGYVGQIDCLGTSFRIQPKTRIENLFGMLELAYDLKSFQVLEGSAPLDSVEELFQILASTLARMVRDRITRGLHREYVECQDRLRVVRGRIEPMATLRYFVRGGVDLECLFEEHTPDVEDNQILAWTLFQLRLYELRPEVRRSVGRAYRGMASEVSLAEFNARDCVGRFYHRLTEDYKPLHSLCRFFLDHLGPLLEGGRDDFVPFILYMPNLFETFVARWLGERLPAWLRLKQHSRVQLDAGGKYLFDIDLVLHETGSDRVVAVLDTKYKRTDRMDSGDIAQIVAYATKMGADRGFLVYPAPLPGDHRLEVGPVAVDALAFDLGESLEVAGEALLGRLLELL